MRFGVGKENEREGEEGKTAGRSGRRVGQVRCLGWALSLPPSFAFTSKRKKREAKKHKQPFVTHQRKAKKVESREDGIRDERGWLEGKRVEGKPEKGRR